ncbi:hypothetical protein GSI_03101 [Ganoderma sinense ZZ0214-1]|uniref:DUF6533 domain-containing protein n=1 Tax=Ganoderma sinense ZZ0214-1 TaxID=1077348 RepID=A0A2G8SKN0_9APHY|nr:hypothetical protein GSI_03101 [Ganoderma sinense ZZ0214-1]
MASQSDNAIDELIAFYAAVQPGGYCGVAVTALVVYDWVVTLPRELQLFWTGKARPLSAILYFSNKYLNLLAQAINLVEYGPISDEAYFGFNLSGTQVPMMGCLENGTITSSLIQTISIFLADTLLIVITWKQFRHEGAGLKTNRTEVLKTKGLAVLLFLNITNLILTQLSESTAVNGNVSLLARFASPLSSVLVSHFLLDLQDAHQRKVVGLDTDDPLYTLQSFNLRSAHLMPALGSLGAVIDPAHYGREEHDELFDVDLEAVPDSAASSEGVFSQDSRTEDSTLGGVERGGSGERTEGI